MSAELLFGAVPVLLLFFLSFRHSPASSLRMTSSSTNDLTESCVLHHALQDYCHGRQEVSAHPTTTGSQFPTLSFVSLLFASSTILWQESCPKWMYGERRDTASAQGTWVDTIERGGVRHVFKSIVRQQHYCLGG